MPWKLGTALTEQDQRAVLAKFVHRFTVTHRPQWAKQPRPCGGAYEPQFANDQDWLAHTLFRVKGNGRLDGRARNFMSSPTWPLREAAE